MTPEALRDLPAALAQVDCSGERHTVRWEAGDLTALDHDDPEGERALAALGGTSCACLEVLAAWSRQRENPALLTALSRGTQDPIQAGGLPIRPFPAYPATTTPRQAAVPPRARARTAGGWVAVTGTTTAVTRRAVPGRAPYPGHVSGLSGEDDIALLAALGHHLSLRMAAGVTAVLLEHLGGPDDQVVRPALEASLFGRATWALRAWLAIPDLEVQLEMTERDAAPSLDWDGTGPVRLALPPEWVMTVWGRDLTVVAGRFTLAVVESAPARTTLTSIGPDLGPPRQLVVELR